MKAMSSNNFILYFILIVILCGNWHEVSGQNTSKMDSTKIQFGGPNSVTGQIAEDQKYKRTLAKSDKLENYFNWKDQLKKDKGLSYTIDYTSGLLLASETKNSDNMFSGGAVRFFGAWDLAGKKSGNTGSFIWKIENRHKYTHVPVSGTAAEIGYSGLFLPTLSDIGTRLTNLYWKQNLNQGRIEIIGGFIDVTDWVDLYALASPWNGFFNFALATGSATIPVPDDATIGIYINAMLTNQLYIIGGLSDTNSISTDPFNGFNTFFNDREYFKTIELGWTTSQDRFYMNNYHITLWHADERMSAGVSSGWGMNFSFSHAFGVKWMPYLRGGYTKDGGSLLQKSLSTGIGYHLKDGVSLFGFGFNWGQPNENTYNAKLRDQYAFELFSRLQVARNFEVTPDLQWIINPALNPSIDQSWVFGIRGRVFF